MDKCPHCKADLKYLRTERGHLMPVNADTVGPDDKLFKPGVHVSHFAICQPSKPMEEMK